MDSNNMTDHAYHELAQTVPCLPRMWRVVKRRQEINNTFDLKATEGTYEGVFTSLKSHLIRTLSSPEKFALFTHNNTVKIKISGDGTRAGSKLHLINFSYTIIGDTNCTSERGNYLLAIVKCPETGDCIRAALKELIDEFNNLDQVVVDEKIVKVEKYLGGDLKFLNQVTGIGGFASIFSCLWCKCPKSDRSDVTKEWSMRDVTMGARTVEEIAECAKKAKNCKTKFNCNSTPIFPSVPISRIVPDTLHMFLRIMDQLVYQLTFYLQHCDNCTRLSASTVLDNCNNLLRFQNFIGTIGIK